MKKLISAFITVALIASMAFSTAASGTVYAKSNIKDGNIEKVFEKVLDDSTDNYGVIEKDNLVLKTKMGSYFSSLDRVAPSFTWVMNLKVSEPYTPVWDENGEDTNSDGDYSPSIYFWFGGASIHQYIIGYDFKEKYFFILDEETTDERYIIDYINPKGVTIKKRIPFITVDWDFSYDEYHTIAFQVKEDGTAVMYFDGIDVLITKNLDYVNIKNENQPKIFRKMNCRVDISEVTLASGDYDEFEKHEHTWTNETVKKPATYHEKGIVHHTCSSCGIERDDETPILECPGHTGGTATCLKKANCSICDREYDSLAAHTFGDFVEVKKPTATQEGLRKATCTVCGSYKTEVIPATGFVCPGHTGGTATCTERAVCDLCGDPYGSTLPHTWDEGVIKTNATETSTGIKLFTCSVCNTTKTEIIPALGGSDSTDDPSNPSDQTPTDNGKPDKNNPDTSSADIFAAAGIVSTLAGLAIVAKKKF